MKRKPAAPSAEPKMTHLSSKGEARMVDVGGKDITQRCAVASAEVTMSVEAFDALRRGEVKKGDALAVARIAGIQGAKRTPDLIPLCHPIALTKAKVEIELIAARRAARIVAEAECEGKTGVEMEALTAAAVAALALYDMLKAIDKGIVIGNVRLERKSGGASGEWAMQNAKRTTQNAK